MGAPLILGTCGLEAASGFVGLTAPGIPGELACGLPVVLGGAEVPTLLWPGAGLAGATPGGLAIEPPVPGEVAPAPVPVAPPDAPPDEPPPELLEPPEDCAIAEVARIRLKPITASFRIESTPFSEVQREQDQAVPEALRTHPITVSFGTERKPPRFKLMHPKTPQTDSTVKTPDWVSGDDLMTGAQASYLKTLTEQLHDPSVYSDDLTKAEASKLIDLLKQKLEETRWPR